MTPDPILGDPRDPQSWNRLGSVVFTLIVGERYEWIGHEAEGFGFEVAEAVQQIAGLALSCAAAFEGSVAGGWGAFPIASCQNIAVAAAEAFSGGFIQTV